MWFRSIRLPTKLPAHHPAQRWIAAVVIALLASAVAAVAMYVPAVRQRTQRLDETFYDILYSFRAPEDRTQGDLVIIAIDDKALQEAGKELFGTPFPWPWPRELYGLLLGYLEQCGAKAVAFDLMMTELSVHQRSDDLALADAVAAAKIPVVFAAGVTHDGKPTPFAPPVANPIFGCAEYEEGTVVRQYSPRIRGMPSLALQTLLVAGGGPMPPRADEPFLLHYYGPHRREDGKFTFPYLSAAHVVRAAIHFRDDGRVTPDFGFDPSVFRGKAVLVGPVAQSLFDLKTTPVSKQYPGIEVHATAYSNLLAGQRVWPLGTATRTAVTLGCSLLASLGIILSRHTAVKLLVAVAVLALLVGEAVILFRGSTIHWLQLTGPLLALLLATVGAFAWSYLTEGRARQLLFRALSQSLSPEMADQLVRNPARLARLGGDRREMTVMFTDIAGFTDLSEKLEVDKLVELMNYYLEEMSTVVLQDRAYLDKYIGDAIMSFWNGVVDQPDHAALACQTALDLQRREREMQPELARRGATGLLTRIGINTGPMSLGNMGSSRKFSFTVLGDSVNFGSRLEGANKIYGSQILIAQTTADQVRDKFVVRKLDLLRVQGKRKPMAVYELMAQAPADPSVRSRAERFEAAFGLYQQQKWHDAAVLLSSLLQDFPEDAPAAALLRRVENLRADPPPPDWDGVYAAKGK
jgi:adenylate cyclase